MAPRVIVQLPAVLAPVSGGDRMIETSGETVGEALAHLVRARPALAMHLFDEGGGVRQYVAFFHNDVYLRPSEGLDRRVDDGDRLTILNSIAGGCVG